MTSTTYDGLPIAPEPPFGASVVVWRRGEAGIEVLLLHRAHHGPDYDGDWAWTPPAGARQPGEHPDLAARRELKEETGLELAIEATPFGSAEWLVYVARAPANAAVVLDAEHDRFEWVTLGDACRRCLPQVVADQLRAAATHLAPRECGVPGPA